MTRPRIPFLSLARAPAGDGATPLTLAMTLAGNTRPALSRTLRSPDNLLGLIQRA